MFHWKPAKKITKWSWGKIRAKLGPMLWKKVKELTLSIGFSHILHGKYILKQEVVVVQTPEWKFKANILEMPHFKDVGIKFLPKVGQKQPKADYFQEFHFS